MSENMKIWTSSTKARGAISTSCITQQPMFCFSSHCKPRSSRGWTSNDIIIALKLRPQKASVWRNKDKLMRMFACFPATTKRRYCREIDWILFTPPTPPQKKNKNHSLSAQPTSAQHFWSLPAKTAPVLIHFILRCQPAQCDYHSFLMLHKQNY